MRQPMVPYEAPQDDEPTFYCKWGCNLVWPLRCKSKHGGTICRNCYLRKKRGGSLVQDLRADH